MAQNLILRQELERKLFCQEVNYSEEFPNYNFIRYAFFFFQKRQLFIISQLVASLGLVPLKFIFPTTDLY